jgi:Family of unknown function (DUF5678)
MLFHRGESLSMRGGNYMPSGAYEEIFQRIPLLTPEEKEQLIGLLRFDRARTDEGSNATFVQTGKNGTEASPVRLAPVRSFDEERKWISQHREQYRGQFVALARSQLLAHGADEGEVIDQARSAGVQSHFVTYIETEAEERYLSGLLIS